MNSIDIKLKQNAKNIKALEEERERLQKEKQEEKLEFGDIVTYNCGNDRLRRVVLYNKNGQRVIYTCTGRCIGWNNIANYYSKTGKNIFKDNLLGLDL